uniref:SAP domain-containing protein n=1 Tax=Solanum lycopersicum TaxID=4081 RepID=A0A3Q7GZU1_SOLLC
MHFLTDSEVHGLKRKMGSIVIMLESLFICDVPALREELKRRNLLTKVLKDDLVNRLNNIIHRERGEPEVEESTEINPDVLECNNKSMGHPQNKVIKGLIVILILLTPPKTWIRLQLGVPMTFLGQKMESSNKDLSDVGSIYPLDEQMPNEMQGDVGEIVDDKSLEPSLSPKKVEVSAEDKHCIAASSDDRKGMETLPSNNENDWSLPFIKLVIPDLMCDVSVHAVLSKISEVVDDQNMEKINLDQSSVDDSMKEDVVETKHVAFDHISNENDKTEESITGMTQDPKVVRNGSSDATQQDNPSENVESPQKTKYRFLELLEKGTFQGYEIKEPAKRQCKWNTENLCTAKPQNLSIALSENLVLTIPVKPIFARTDSTVSKDAPKEPWCSSVEEAIENRNAIYNLQWPPKEGRLLVANFVDPQQVPGQWLLQRLQ